MTRIIRSRHGNLRYLSALAVLACASPPVPANSVALDPVAGTYRMLVHERVRRTAENAPLRGTLVLSSEVLPERTVRALERRTDLGEGGNGIDPATANGCIRWASADTARAPSPSVSTIRWVRRQRDSIFVNVHFYLDYGYTMHLNPHGIDTLVGVGDRYVLRLAGTPAAPGDSVVLIRMAPADPAHCLAR